MRLSAAMKAAINTYYAFRRTPTRVATLERGGSLYNVGWPDSATKERICQHVCDVAATHGISVSIVPGTIFLRRGTQRLQVNGPIEP